MCKVIRNTSFALYCSKSYDVNNDGTVSESAEEWSKVINATNGKSYELSAVNDFHWASCEVSEALVTKVRQNEVNFEPTEPASFGCLKLSVSGSVT